VPGVVAAVMRLRIGAALVLSSAALDAGAMPPPADSNAVACGVGLRATLADGRRVRVTAADTDGRCRLAVYGGGSASAFPSELSLEPPPAFDLDATPPRGVYACHAHGMGLDPATSIGLIDASNWRNAAGERGAYRYDARTRELELTSGAWSGRRFLRNAGTTLQKLEADGTPGSTACVLDDDRDVEALRW
jgi:hypothetical protein